MRLYHFTSHLWWRFIKDEGITKGEAPIGGGRVYCYPNLTDNPDPGAQAWVADTLINKKAIRITLDIPEDDEILISWRTYAEAHGISRADYRNYDKSGGWQARHWWIYRGVVAPHRFLVVEILGDPTELEEDLIKIAERSSSYDDFLDQAGLTGAFERCRLGDFFTFDKTNVESYHDLLDSE